MGRCDVMGQWNRERSRFHQSTRTNNFISCGGYILFCVMHRLVTTVNKTDLTIFPSTFVSLTIHGTFLMP